MERINVKDADKDQWILSIGFLRLERSCEQSGLANLLLIQEMQ
jgi:hypothetical protein